MDGLIGSLMLICAVLAALAAGVLLGYMACKALFAVCSLHVRALGAARRTAQAETHAVNA